MMYAYKSYCSSTILGQKVIVEANCTFKKQLKLLTIEILLVILNLFYGP
jgi:hypothetical protein